MGFDEHVTFPVEGTVIGRPIRVLASGYQTGDGNSSPHASTEESSTPSPFWISRTSVTRTFSGCQPLTDGGWVSEFGRKIRKNIAGIEAAMFAWPGVRQSRHLIVLL